MWDLHSATCMPGGEGVAGALTYTYICLQKNTFKYIVCVCVCLSDMCVVVCVVVWCVVMWDK